MVTEAVINTAKKYIRCLPPELNVRQAYIFGSYAKGTQRDESDIDIAVIVAHMDDFFEVQMELFRRRREIDLRIEPHPFDIDDFTENNPVAAEIIRTGIEVLNEA